MISQGLLDELRLILKEDYGQDLTPERVFEIGNTLVGYFDLLAKFSQKNKDKNEEQNSGEKN